MSPADAQFFAKYRGITIRCITLQQPWATLLAYGWLYPGELKQIETRSWSSHYRGALAIHAAASLKPDSRAALKHPHIRTALRRLGITRAEQLPLGQVLAVGVLADVRKIVLPAIGHPAPGEMLAPPVPEYYFGLYEAGRYGWHFSEMHVLPKPIPYSGALSLWPFKFP